MRSFIAHPYGIECVLYPRRDVFADATGLPLDQVRGMRGCCALAGTQAHIGVFDRRLHTLVHESVHAAHMILRHCGVKTPSSDYGEAHAYLTEYVFSMARAKE